MMLTPEQLTEIRHLLQEDGNSYDGAIVTYPRSLYAMRDMMAHIDAQRASIADLEMALFAENQKRQEIEKDADRYRVMRSYFISPDDTDLFDVIMREMLKNVNSERGDDAFPTDQEFDSAVDRFYKSTK